MTGLDAEAWEIISHALAVSSQPIAEMRDGNRAISRGRARTSAATLGARSPW